MFFIRFCWAMEEWVNNSLTLRSQGVDLTLRKDEHAGHGIFFDDLRHVFEKCFEICLAWRAFELPIGEPRRSAREINNKRSGDLNWRRSAPTRRDVKRNQV